MDPGEVRLVARIDERLPGAETSPTPSQILPATLAVVHLLPGQQRSPAPDVNAKSDQREIQPTFDGTEAPLFGPSGVAPSAPASTPPTTSIPPSLGAPPAAPSPVPPTTPAAPGQP
jgi:hypothetical protein